MMMKHLENRQPTHTRRSVTTSLNEIFHEKFE